MLYGRAFFRNRKHEAESSAIALAPIILSILSTQFVHQEVADDSAGGWERLKDPDPAGPSMIDVGCGDGSWVDAFLSLGVKSYGVDGPWSPFADALKVDLSNGMLPVLDNQLPSRVDFILCLELLEHLQPEAGARLLRWMTARTDILVMSAAVPFQGGTGHVNEQWPDHWAKELSRMGFFACDALRPMIWNDQRIAPWYRQNIVVYFRHAVPPAVQEAAERNWKKVVAQPLALVHPDLIYRKRRARLLGRLGL